MKLKEKSYKKYEENSINHQEIIATLIHLKNKLEAIEARLNLPKENM